MTPESFNKWLAEMRATYVSIRSDKAAGELLGISANSIVKMKQRGCDRRTALACRALLHHLEPYS